MSKKIPEATITKIRDEIEKVIIDNPLLTKEGIATHFGICRTKLYYIERDNEDIRKKIADAEKIRDDEIRPRQVEDKFISRLINGEASETGYIFYLTNKMPDKYKDRRNVIGSVNVSASSNAEIIDLEERAQQLRKSRMNFLS